MPDPTITNPPQEPTPVVTSLTPKVETTPPTPVTAAPVPSVKPVTPPVKPAVATPSLTPRFVFNKEKLAAHIAEVVDFLETFAGKKAHNPFFIINNKIKPLIKRLETGEESPELHDAVMALKKETPVIPLLEKNHQEEERQMKERKHILNLPPRQG